MILTFRMRKLKLRKVEVMRLPRGSTARIENQVDLISEPPGGSDGKVCLQCRRPKFNPWVGKIPWRRKWQPTPVFLPGKSHGQRSLEGGYSSLSHKQSDMTEQLHFHFHFA